MAVRTAILIVAATIALWAQETTAPADFTCPMDKDVHAASPGKCPRCGMKLVASLPEPVEYPLRLTFKPAAPRPGQNVELRFQVLDPKSGAPVTSFETVHEKLFHLFIISEDLTHFAHEHPTVNSDGTFHFTYKLPATGAYRILGDFYPAGGTPQLIAKTLIAPGPRHPAALTADLTPKLGVNLQVKLRTEPSQPIAGGKTMLFFELDPVEGLTPYLGAWGHMLAASSDLIDMIHTHPAFADPGKAVQFNMIFPRPGTYRVWVQFQRSGRVNTVAFNVPVSVLQ